MYIEGVKIIIETKLKNQVVQYLETCSNNEYADKLCYEVDEEESGQILTIIYMAKVSLETLLNIQKIEYIDWKLKEKVKNINKLLKTL